MIQRINNYLLVHHPLVWNTRLLWVAAINGLLHLLFFVAGVSAISAGSIAYHYSIGNVGGTGLYTFSVLCSLLVFIVWCVFYLRNNAFKNFYRIGKWWLAKEFFIICVLIGTSITYFLSFQWGVRTKVRSITNQQQLVQEINTVNAALVYLPFEKTDYFILNSCAERKKRDTLGGQDEIRAADELEIRSIDTTQDLGTAPTNNEMLTGRDQQDAQIRTALRRPDAFSYLHYCKKFLNASEGNDEIQLNERNQRWLQQGRRDSVQATLQALLPILKKYNIKYRLSVDSTLGAVFSDSLFSVDKLVANQQYNFVNGYEVANPAYLERSNLDYALHLVESCQLTPQNREDRLEEWLVAGYTTLGLSILLLCYRRFSRKVFLASVVGTLVWAVLVGLFAFGGGGGNGETFFITLLALDAFFLAGGLLLLQQKSSKTLAGVLLNWHSYLVPYTLPLIIALIQVYYDKQSNYGFNYTNDYMANEAILQQRFPISHWVTHHVETLFALNLLVSVVYIAFLFNPWAKRWQAAPEE